jgi:hypothetical protein
MPDLFPTAERILNALASKRFPVAVAFLHVRWGPELIPFHDPLSAGYRS